MDVFKTIVHDLVSIGFTPGMVVLLFLIVFFLKNPNAFDRLFGKKKNNNSDGNGNNGKKEISLKELSELVKRSECHEAMSSVAISVNNVSTEIHEGFSQVHNRVDKLYDTLIKKK
jgi:hypothetical protein